MSVHPAIDVVNRLVREKELSKLCHGTYSYPFGSSMLHECCNCRAKSEDDTDIPHKEGCPQIEYNALKRVNLEQLKLLRELVVDSFEIRRMLCIHSNPMAYMDDGEASDSSELPVIDYLRDSSREIKDKIVARMVAKKLEGR